MKEIHEMNEAELIAREGELYTKIRSTSEVRDEDKKMNEEINAIKKRLLEISSS